eukprot:2715045-Amphidinium_carterae.1
MPRMPKGELSDIRHGQVPISMVLQIYPPREMPDSSDPDWEAIANAQPLTGEDLEAAVNDRLLNILTPTPVAKR